MIRIRFSPVVKCGGGCRNSVGSEAEVVVEAKGNEIEAGGSASRVGIYLDSLILWIA